MYALSKHLDKPEFSQKRLLHSAKKCVTIISSQPAGIYSTKLEPVGIKKEEMLNPSDLRCGSVETCRNADRLSSAAVRAHAKMVGALKVEVYGNCNPEKHQEDLPVQRR